MSLLAGLDLHTGRVTEIVSDHHASVDFIALLGKLEEGYSAQTRIRILLDDHSGHTSKETQAWLKLPPKRFEFVFTPPHGSWRSIAETMFSKMARVVGSSNPLGGNVRMDLLLVCVRRGTPAPPPSLNACGHEVMTLIPEGATNLRRQDLIQNADHGRAVRAAASPRGAHLHVLNGRRRLSELCPPYRR